MATQFHYWSAKQHLLLESNVHTSATPKSNAAENSFIPFLSSIYSHTTCQNLLCIFKIGIFADDLKRVSHHPRVDETVIQLQICLTQLEMRFTADRMSAKGSKSLLTVVTSLNKKYRQTHTVSLMSQYIPVNTDRNINCCHYRRWLDLSPIHAM